MSCLATYSSSEDDEDIWQDNKKMQSKQQRQRNKEEESQYQTKAKNKKKAKPRGKKAKQLAKDKDSAHLQKYQLQQLARMSGEKGKNSVRGVQKGTVRMTGNKLWVQPKWFDTKAQQDKHLNSLALAAGMDPTSPVTWQFIPVLSREPSTKPTQNPGFWSRRVKCPFVLECKCPVEHKIVFDPKRKKKGLPAFGVFTRQDTSTGSLHEHSHKGFAHKQGVPSVIVKEMTAERLLRSTCHEFIRDLGRWESTKDLKIQGEFDPEWVPGSGMEYCVARSQIINCWKRKKRKVKASIETFEIPAEGANTFAEIRQRIKPFLKEPEHDHDPYCIGYWLDSREGLNIIIVIMATKTMLMNMWLNDTVPGVVHGMCMDDTYGTNKMGYPLNVFGGVDVAQRFRNYSFSITNKETTYAYQYILRTVMDAAMKVVEEKKEAQRQSGRSPKPEPYPSQLKSSKHSTFTSDFSHASWIAAKIEIGGLVAGRDFQTKGRTFADLSDAQQSRVHHVMDAGLQRSAFPPPGSVRREKQDKNDY